MALLDLYNSVVLWSDQVHIYTIVCCSLQVCDHPALLSDNAADLVATGGTNMHSHGLEKGHAINRMVRVLHARQMLSLGLCCFHGFHLEDLGHCHGVQSQNVCYQLS